MKLKYSFIFAMLGLVSVLCAQPAEPDDSSAATPRMDNVTIHIKGVLNQDMPMDFSFTTAGPTFNLQQQISQLEHNGVEHPITGSCQITIAPLAAGYRVRYVIGVRFPVIVSSTTSLATSSATTTVTYNNIAFAGSVILQSGQPVTILNSDGKDLIISLNKLAAP